MPSDEGRSRARNVEPDSSSRIDDDARPSPNVPRDGNERVIRNERPLQRRFVIDCDAIAGYFSADDFADSGYLNAETWEEDYHAQMHDLYEDSIG